MNQQSQKLLNRRSFLKRAGVVASTAVGAMLLDTYRPWLNVEQEAHAIRNTQADEVQNQKHALIGYAVLAANGHNAQPWRFALTETGIQIHPDGSRRLTVVDPNDRELWISLGCALENLLVAASSMGFASEVVYPDIAEWIDIRLIPEHPNPHPLFPAILTRQNTRSSYDGQPVKDQDLIKIQNLPVEPGITLHFVDHATEMKTLLEYVNQGNQTQFSDPSFIEELIFWLRFNQKTALVSKDGLYTKCSGNPEVPTWLGKMFLASTNPQQQVDADALKLRSSAGSVVIASQTDNRSAWVQTGQVYQRLALQMAALNIKSALLNQPIETPELRPQFQSAMGLGRALPQLALRYGYAKSMPYSLRRPVGNVLMNASS